MAYFNFSLIDNTKEGPDFKVGPGNLADYNLEKFDPKKFLRQIIEESESPSGIQDIVELYSICAKNPMDTVISGRTKIRSLYCGRETTSYNTEKYDGEGYKLMELRYYDCDPESQLIYFKYPYTEEKQLGCTFDVRMFINNPIVYNSVLRKLYEYPRPILLYTEFNLVGDVLGTVESEHQIARM